MSKQQTKLEKLISEGKVVRIEASKLSLNDEIMKYNPTTDEEKAFKTSFSFMRETSVKREGTFPNLKSVFTKIAYTFNSKILKSFDNCFSSIFSWRLLPAQEEKGEI